MRIRNDKKGFTFTEVLIVIAILLILAVISIVTFKNLGATSSHRVVTQEIFTMLTEARNNTIASEGDNVYGVHFEATSTTLFEGDTYSVSDPNNIQFEFSGGVYATSTLISNTTDVVFKRLTGFPTVAGTLYIVRNDGNATNTITVHDTGLIEN